MHDMGDLGALEGWPRQWIAPRHSGKILLHNSEKHTSVEAKLATVEESHELRDIIVGAYERLAATAANGHNMSPVIMRSRGEMLAEAASRDSRPVQACGFSIRWPARSRKSARVFARFHLHIPSRVAHRIAACARDDRCAT